EKTTPTKVKPEPAGFAGVNPGHEVEFRQSAGDPLNSVIDADLLFLPDSPRAFAAFDNGVGVINYADFATNPPPQQHFRNDRDIRAVPGNGFGPGDQDNYAMHSSGFLLIPQAGRWNFTVNSDDGFEFLMGTDNTRVGASSFPKAASDVEFAAFIPAPGLYHY